MRGRLEGRDDDDLTLSQMIYVVAFMAFVRQPTARAYLERREAFRAVMEEVTDHRPRGDLPRPCERCGRLMRGCALARHQAGPHCVPLVA